MTSQNSQACLGHGPGYRMVDFLSVKVRGDTVLGSLLADVDRAGIAVHVGKTVASGLLQMTEHFTKPKVKGGVSGGISPLPCL